LFGHVSYHFHYLHPERIQTVRRGISITKAVLMPAATYEVSEGIGIITLNRPEALNAINAALSSDVGNALEAAAADPAVQVVIVTGRGRAFCVGADLKELDQKRSLEAAGHPEWGFAGLVQHWVDKPVIAAVNGFALGGGTEIVLAADLAVAADTAVFGLPEVKVGLLATAGGVVRLQQQIPLKRALELTLTGDHIDAGTALELGLVNRVVPVERVLDEALALAGRIASNAPLSVRHTKRMIHRTWRGGSDWNPAWTGEDPWQVNAEAMATVFATSDAAEGTRAFSEKRPPRWEGR
jgi:crotonobetainyl-CoA hydratase